MNGSLTDVAKLGLCHHTLFPCKDDPAYHLETLPRILERDDIEVVDLTIPYGDRYRQRAINLVRGAGKTVVYNGYLLPTPKIPLGTLSPTERAQILLLAKEQVDVAYEAGASIFMQSVGADPGPDRRGRAFDGLAEYISELRAYMRRRGDLPLCIELMDRETDKRSLCGPTAEVVAFLDRLALTVSGVGLVADMAHVPLMNETFEENLAAAHRYLRHVHLGNCILRDRTHPWWGDQHPPIGMAGGEVDVPELQRILRSLRDLHYIGLGGRGTLTLEIRPFPGRTVEETVLDNFERVRQAWATLE
jgi:sugar phosphate isomerase/epimerase